MKYYNRAFVGFLVSENSTPPLRPIRSFVRREGRLTPGQQRAISTHWQAFGIDHPGGLLDFQALFGSDENVELEIGCGDGGAMLEMSRQRPHHHFLGIEVYRPGVGKLLQGLVNAGQDNVRVFNADAVDVIDTRIPNQSLKRIMVFFPDPWPKKKHQKRRLLSDSFIELLIQKLKQGGELHIATDWQEYAEQVANILSHATHLKSRSDSIYSARPETRPLTKYERRGQRLGHGVWDIVMEKI